MTPPVPRQWSLQRHLLMLVLGMVSALWVVAAGLTWYDARHELDELLDGHLAQAAALLVVQQAAGGDDDGVADAPSLHRYAPRVAFQVFHEGQLVMRSANTQATPMSPVSAGFATVSLADGQHWRIFSAKGARNDVQVYVGEQLAARDEVLRAVLRSVLWPLLVALPLLALAVWWAVRRGLVPLRQLGSALHARQASDLEPVVLADMPSEMQAPVRALNGLFARVARMMESERRFTADAAHELRTPIAAIRAQAQVALGAGTDTVQREHALQFTLAGCDRATRLVEQLLTLARVEAAPAAHAATIDMAALVRRVMADLAPAALARHQHLELDAGAGCLMAGDGVLMGVLVRNLIDNAVRYSPAHGLIRVRVAAQGGQLLLGVEDSGTGLDDEAMRRLGERFYRVPGNDQPGSGLGWSIVKRIALVSGAEVRVSRSAELGGLAVNLQWPLAATP
ncbi:MAG: ATP-binding protein [Pseudomonadota bacterium]